MSVLRSDVLCPVFGSGRKLATNVLPTYGDVMRCYLWYSQCQINNKKNKPLKDLVRNTSDIVALKVEDIWKMASIPIVDHCVVVKRIREYKEKYRQLLKSYNSRKSIESYINKLDKFRAESNKLFDIATCKCPTFDQCNCERIRKIPLDERDFIYDQRNERKMMIGNIDTTATKKQTQLLKRKYQHEEYKNKILEETYLHHHSEAGPSMSKMSKSPVPVILQSASTLEEPSVCCEDKTGSRQFPVVARTLDRYGISDRAGAAIVSATLQDMGLINEEDYSKVVDRNMIRRVRAKKRSNLSKTLQTFDYDNFGLYFDGRKDKTLTMIDNHRKIIVEEHVSLVKEPGSEYIGHISLTSSTANDIKEGVLEFFSNNSINLQKVVAIGCDGTITNTEHKGGVIRLLELELKKPIHWFVCQLHANELPLQHLFHHLDGTTSGPRAFRGPIGKALSKYEYERLVKYEKINCSLPEISKKDLGTDQKYLLDMCHAIDSGACSLSLSKRNPGKMVHSRWLTTANRILRLYVSSSDPSPNLVILATFIIKVYAPMWFFIKSSPSCINGPKHLCQLIVVSRYLPEDLKAIIDPVIQRNGFFGHPENILLAMLCDERQFINELALRRIIKVRRSPQNENTVRTFFLPDFNFSATEYSDLIDWQSAIITEPPVTKCISEELQLDKKIQGPLLHFC